VPQPPNPGRNMLPMELKILLEAGGTLESIAARAVAAAAEVAAAAAAAAAAATAAAEGGAPAVLDTAVKKEKGKGGPAPAWREQTLKRKRSFFEACESVPYYIRPLKVKQDIDRYSDRYKKIASMSTVPWDKAWAVDIVDLKVTKGSGRAHRLIIDGRLDDASTDLDLDAETAGLEGSPKKGDADGSDGEDQPEVVLQEPEDEEDNDDYAKSYFDPGDDDEDDGDDVDKED